MLYGMLYIKECHVLHNNRYPYVMISANTCQSSRCIAQTHSVKLVGLFKTPCGNLALTSFKSLAVCNYSVLSGYAIQISKTLFELYWFY